MLLRSSFLHVMYAGTVLGVSFVTSGCIKTKAMQGNSAPASGLDTIDKHTVMVIDGGFDDSNPLLKHRIKASYTLSCSSAEVKDPKNDSNEKPSSPRFFGFDPKETNPAKHKEEILKSLATTEDCSLRPGFDRPENKVLLGHGTATAGIVSAHEKADLVLVHWKDIGDPTKASEKHSGIPCPTTEALSAMIKALKDSEVQRAYQNADTSFTVLMEDLARKHKVTVVNASFGLLGPQTMTWMTMLAANCLEAELSEFFKATLHLQSLQEKGYRERHPDAWLNSRAIQVWAAGNDKEEASEQSKHGACGKSGDTSIVVGAENVAPSVFGYFRSTFTTHGKCIDVYAPGSNIPVLSVNGGKSVKLKGHTANSSQEEVLVTRASGTSFSAPLVSWLITEKFAPGTPPQKIKEEMIKMAGSDQMLSDGLFDKYYDYIWGE